MFVGHDDSGTSCVILDEKASRLFCRGRAEVLECLDIAQQRMTAVPEISLSGDSFIDQFVQKPEPFPESVLDDNHATIKGHAAWY